MPTKDVSFNRFKFVFWHFIFSSVNRNSLKLRLLEYYRKFSTYKFIVIKTHVRVLIAIYIPHRIIFNRLEFMNLYMRIWARCESSNITIRYSWSKRSENQDVTNAIKVRVLQSPESQPVRRTNILVIYIRAHLSLPRPGVLLVCLIILIRVVSALACRGIGAGEGLARAMLAMSGKGGML